MEVKDSCLLSDTEVIELSSDLKDKPLIKPFDSEKAKGGSYSLRIGTVHKPKFEESIKSDDRQSWIVEPGQMIFIVTHEKLQMPKDIVGIVFGANRMTMQGLLIVNPGIITSGHMREVTFYAINFSKNAITLTEKEDIARAVFFRSKENFLNPHNESTNAKTDATRNAQKNFYQDFQGYFKSLIGACISKYIFQIFLQLVVGTLIFGSIIATTSVISTIIVDRMQKVPQLRQEIAELRKEISEISSPRIPLEYPKDKAQPPQKDVTPDTSEDTSTGDRLESMRIEKSDSNGIGN